jgi:hypothetical protein
MGVAHRDSDYLNFVIDSETAILFSQIPLADVRSPVPSEVPLWNNPKQRSES